MEINLKKIRIINVTLSICVALVMSGIVMDFQFMGARRDLSRTEGGEKKAAPRAPARATSDFTENEVILKGGLMAPGGRLLYMRDKPKKKVSKRPALNGKTIKAPNTNLSLKGTIVSDVGKSLAIFEDIRSKRQEIISIGGDVFGAGKITVIDEDRVLLSASGGVTHEYSMDFEANNGARPRAGGNARRGRPGGGRGNGVVAKAKWTEELKMMQDMQRVNGSGAVGHHVDTPYDDPGVVDDEDVIDDFLDDPAGEVSLLPGASESFISPVLEDRAGDVRGLASLSAAPTAKGGVDWWDAYDALGSGAGDALTYVSYNSYPSGEPVSGFMVSGSHDGLFSSVFGLASGDVIIKVNETPLDTAGAWLRASDGLWNAPNIRLSVLRDGIEARFDFEVR